MNDIILEKKECFCENGTPFYMVANFPYGLGIKWCQDQPCPCGNLDFVIVERPVQIKDGQGNIDIKKDYWTGCPKCVRFRPGEKIVGEFDAHLMVTRLHVVPSDPPRPAGPLVWSDPVMSRLKVIPPEVIQQIKEYADGLKDSARPRPPARRRRWKPSGPSFGVFDED